MFDSIEHITSSFHSTVFHYTDSLDDQREDPDFFISIAQATVEARETLAALNECVRQMEDNQ